MTMDRIASIMVILLLLLAILPAVDANPMPYEIWENAQGGGAPEPVNVDPDITFFKEYVEADIGKRTVDLHAEYWFRNEGPENGTMRIILPLSKDPKDIELEADGHQTGWTRTSYFFQNERERIDCVAIVFEILFMPFEERKVTVEYEEDLSVYDTTLNDHVSYFFWYLVGSAREWNRSLETARFEFKVPMSMWDRGDHDGWERTTEGKDHVLTKEYSDWIPQNDVESISWERDRRTPVYYATNYPLLCLGLCGASIVIVLTLVVLIVFRISSKRKRKKGHVRG